MTARTGGWTVDTLHLHLDRMFAEMDKRNEQRWQATERAIAKAEAAADRRFELLNELRSGVAAREQVEAVEKQLDELKGRLDKTEGRAAGLGAGWVYLVAAVGLATTVVGLILAFRR
jgi:hypothetical protein